jgi:dolichol-phosphate mannosyltransferase
MKIVVIIPTYNERENIGLLIDALQREFEKIPHNMNLLIVDDNSPDGTADIVKTISENYINVHLITGDKKGLGNAYIRGMKHAIEKLSADVVMEMDADFSHRPEDVPRMVSAIDKGFDFVIGSRYVDDGKIPEEWGIIRRMISKWGNIFARYIAGLYKIKDCTAGFRAIQSSIIKKINLDNLRVQGYAFQVALLHKAIVNHAKVKEIPVEFVDRRRGESKLGITDIFEFIINALWIRLESGKTFIKFSIVGTSGVFVNLGSFTLFIHSGLNKFIASPISIEVSIISNFILNHFWTFRERNNRDKFHIKGLRFNVVSFIALGVSYLTFVLLSLLFPNVLPQIHQAIGIIPATLVNYLLNSYWTYAERLGTPLNK